MGTGGLCRGVGWPSWSRARVDAVSILRGQEANRIAELIPLRYSRMLVSPFTFYRGAAAVMAADLAARPAGV